MIYSLKWHFHQVLKEKKCFVTDSVSHSPLCWSICPKLPQNYELVHILPSHSEIKTNWILNQHLQNVIVFFVLIQFVVNEKPFGNRASPLLRPCSHPAEVLRAGHPWAVLRAGALGWPHRAALNSQWILSLGAAIPLQPLSHPLPAQLYGHTQLTRWSLPMLKSHQPAVAQSQPLLGNFCSKAKIICPKLPAMITLTWRYCGRQQLPSTPPC